MNIYKHMSIWQKRYNEKGFDINGYHKDTGTKYDVLAYDQEGYDKYEFDSHGKDKTGFTVEKTSERKQRFYHIKKNIEDLCLEALTI